MEDLHFIAPGTAGQPNFSKKQETHEACRIPERSGGKNPDLTPAQPCNTRMKETEINSTKTDESMKKESKEGAAATSPRTFSQTSWEVLGKTGSLEDSDLLCRNSHVAIISNWFLATLSSSGHRANAPHQSPEPTPVQRDAVLDICLGQKVQNPPEELWRLREGPKHLL